MADREAQDREEIPPVIDAPMSGRALRPEVETLPSYIPEDIDVNYTALLQKFKERAMFVDGVRKEALQRTKPQHWLSRKQKDGTRTFSLMGPGAERIRIVAPIGFMNKRRREESWTKEHGPGYTVYYEAEVYLGSPRTGLMPVIGSCSSDDDFFSTEHAELPYNVENAEHKAALDSGEGRLTDNNTKIYIRRRIPASEVTKENIEKSALTNLIVNGVTRILGIRSISAEELKEVGVDADKIGGFEYGSNKTQSGALAPAEEQKRTDIKKMLLEMHEGDETKALADLKKRTAFNDYGGCQGWDKLTPKQIPRHYDAIKKDYDAFRGDGPQKQQQTTQQQGDKAAQGAGAPKGQRGTGGKPAQPEQGPGGQQPLL
jgi:hypothetical protein